MPLCMVRSRLRYDAVQTKPASPASPEVQGGWLYLLFPAPLFDDPDDQPSFAEHTMLYAERDENPICPGIDIPTPQGLQLPLQAGILEEAKVMKKGLSTHYINGNITDYI